MKSTTIFLFLTAVLLCTQAYSQRIFKESLPEGFNCAGCILVIFKQEPMATTGSEKKIHTKLNERIEKDLIANYDGKTLFTSAVDFDTNKVYRDTAIYRFILGIDVYKVNQHMATKKNIKGEQEYLEYNQYGLNCHVYDRFTKKGYPQMTNHPNLSKHLEAVAGALNKLLKE